MNIYRVYPTLWTGGICNQAATVYAIDRTPPPNTFPVQCCSRPKEDPASSWDSPTIQRILPPPLCGSSELNAVTWYTLPQWLSFAQSVGYTLNVEFSALKPYSDIYITGP